jgi:hypothetical protein
MEKHLVEAAPSVDPYNSGGMLFDTSLITSTINLVEPHFALIGADQLHYVVPLQVACLISQSVVLGYLTEYFGINEPTGEETRNAYLYAAGRLFSFQGEGEGEGEGVLLIQ